MAGGDKRKGGGGMEEEEAAAPLEEGGGEQGPGQEDEGWGARFHTNSQRPLLLTVFLSEDERTLLR